jgi:transcription elongation GreA/GreB family factor
MPEQKITRLRRESRSEAAIGTFVKEASAEADNRVARAVAGPPPADEEKEILAGSAHEPVRLYSRVLVTDLEQDEQLWLQVVEDGKGDPLTGAVSVSAPLGRALLMEYPGAVVAVRAPGGRRLYRILRVEG